MANKSVFYSLIGLIMLMMNGCFYSENERRNQKTNRQTKRKFLKFYKV